MAEADPLLRELSRPLGRIPSGVYVLSAAHEDLCGAMLVSWVQQAALRPLALTVAVSQQRAIVPMILTAGRFALSILGEGDHALMRRYARESVLGGQGVFDGLRTITTPAGIPVLADALGYVECSLLQAVDFDADHRLLVGQVTASAQVADARPFVHLRPHGLHY